MVGKKFQLMADTFFCAGFGSVQFWGAQSTVLLPDMMSVFDEAFIVSILNNDHCQWWNGKLKNIAEDKMQTLCARRQYPRWWKKIVNNRK
jgi:hypothetical protein